MNTNFTSINDRLISYPILLDVKDALTLKNVSPRTVENYLCGISRFLEFIHYDNQFEITEKHFRDYLFYLHSSSLKKASINANNSYIRFFFLSVLDKPLNFYRVPMSKFNISSIDFLFDHQIIELLSVSYSSPIMDCIIKLALCCGFRINEIVSLRVSDIHTKDKNNMLIFVRESKRNRSRYVPLDQTSYDAIQRYAKIRAISPGTDDFFFSFVKKKKTCNETIRLKFNELIRQTTIPDSVTFHSLRHTYSVNFLRAGGNILDLKYRLGHSSLASTSRYLHFARNMMTDHISYVDTLMKGTASYDDYDPKNSLI